jgi:hypothetical protein
VLPNSTPGSVKIDVKAANTGSGRYPYADVYVGIASYDSVVNNQVGQDISFHTRDTQTWRGIPAYASGNTSTNGVANYNDGTYVFLASDPDP